MDAKFAPIVDRAVFDLRPDYCAISVVAEGLANVVEHGATSDYIEKLLSQEAPPWGEGHLEAWRAAYRMFGAKPQRTPSSAEALLSRFSKDHKLPTINAVVDLYNAVSIRYVIPVGGENIDAYIGSPRLMRAGGAELFDTTKAGEVQLESVPAGEVIWADGQGVTCRRWNWRQGIRTRIDSLTRRMWFVLERLEPMPVAAAEEAAAALVQGLRQISLAARFSAERIERTGTTPLPSLLG